MGKKKSNAVAVVKSPDDLASELKVESLIPEINANHRECLRAGNESLNHAMQLGDLLWKLKECVKHGGWESLIEKRCDFSPQWAGTCMRLSVALPAILKKTGKDAAGDMTIRGGLKLIAESKRDSEPNRKQNSISPKSNGASLSTSKKDTPQPAKESEPEQAADDGPLNDEPEKELTFEERVREANGRIESFCRQIVKCFEEHCPKLESVDHLGRYDSALAQIKAACSTLRTCKYHDEPCPKCKGDGCSKCEKESDFGAVTVLTYRQLAG